MTVHDDDDIKPTISLAAERKARERDFTAERELLIKELLDIGQPIEKAKAIADAMLLTDWYVLQATVILERWDLEQNAEAAVELVKIMRGHGPYVHWERVVMTDKSASEAMRAAILLGALLATAPASADSFWAKQWAHICTSTEHAAQLSCGFYALGVAEALVLWRANSSDPIGLRRPRPHRPHHAATCGGRLGFSREKPELQ